MFQFQNLPHADGDLNPGCGDWLMKKAIVTQRDIVSVMLKQITLLVRDARLGLWS
jgi:hypothetical protein